MFSRVGLFVCCIKMHIFFNDTATTEIYTYGHTLSLHDALPISRILAATADAIMRRRHGLIVASRARSRPFLVAGDRRAASTPAAGRRRAYRSGSARDPSATNGA